MRACLVVLLGWSAGCGPASNAAPPRAEAADPIGAVPSLEAPAADALPVPDVIRLEASGDLVLNALAMGFVHAHERDAEGYRALLDGYASVLEPDALTYLNLEMPLVDHHVELDGGWPRSRTERPRRAPVLGASVALADVLAELGVELVGVANNHALDQGHAGLRETLAALDGARLVHAGVDASDPYAARVVEHGGHRVAFLAATDAMNRRSSDGPALAIARLDPDAPLLAAITEARARAELVIVAVHWSSDFVAEVSGSQRRLARRLIDAGADVVLGTGPHVLQPIEHLESARGQALVAYSLGNLASGMGRAYRVGVEPDHYIHPANVLGEGRDGVVLSMAITFEPIVIEPIARLLFMENDWMAERAHPTLRVAPLTDVPVEICEERLARARAALGATVPVVPDTCSHRPTEE